MEQRTIRQNTEVKYFVETKGIKSNKYNWSIVCSYDTRKEALKRYNSISKYGANVRIVKEVIKNTYKVVAKK